MRPNNYQVNKDLSLKPYRQIDEDCFVEMSLDEKVIKYMDGASGVEQEERELFQKIFTIYTDSTNTRIFNIWGIYKKDQLCGHLELKETADTTAAELEIVYMIHPAARRQGIMLEVLNYIKNNQTIWQRKIVATVHPKNTPSFRLLEKWGIEKSINYPKEGFVKVYLKTI